MTTETTDPDNPSPLLVAKYGFTVLHEPHDTEIVAEIVFVHGLMGHPVDTWTFGKVTHVRSEDVEASKTSWTNRWFMRSEIPDPSSSTTGCYWPLDLLPTDFPNARVLTYGYESHPTTFWEAPNQMSITDHSADLFDKLTSERHDTRGRPLIFVSHSLGGILVKGALIQSRDMLASDPRRDIADSCCAVFFFGTPHLGADIARWGTMLRNIFSHIPGTPASDLRLLDGLKPESETLQTFATRFDILLGRRMKDAASQTIRIGTIQEAFGMTGITGASSKVVDDNSSKLNRPEIERRIFANANHMNMCKFQPKSSDYKAFRGILTDFIDDIDRMRPQVGAQHKSSASVGVQSLLDQLEYDNQDSRKRQLDKINTHTTPESFAWVWTSALASWLKSSEQLFWLNWKPGSGKSSVINHVFRCVQNDTDKLLHMPVAWLVLNFFFDFRAGNNTPNNLEGFMKSLLWQASRLSAHAKSLLEGFCISLDRSTEAFWDETTLITALELVLSKVNQPTLLFIDGLDEPGGDRSELVWLIRTLLRAHDNVKICLASRPDPPFSTSFQDGSSLAMHLANTPAIKFFCVGFLKDMLGLLDTETMRFIDHWASEIALRADGIFIWAKFAIGIVFNSKTAFEDEKEIEDKLTSLPLELKDLYSRIVATKSVEDRHKMGLLLRLVVTRYSWPVSVHDLYEAFTLINPTSPHKLGAARKRAPFEFEKRMSVLTGGLLEATYQGPKSRGSDSSSTSSLRSYYGGKNEEEANTTKGNNGSGMGEEAHRGFNVEGTYTSQNSSDHRDDPYFLKVRLLHRTTATYLETGGWSDLFGAGNPETLFKDLAWLRIGAEFLADPGEPRRGIPDHTYLPSSLKHDQYREEDLSFPWQQGFDRVGEMFRGFRIYVHLFLPCYAYDYEQESCDSSARFMETITPTAAREHIAMCTENGGDNACCELYYQAPRFKSVLETSPLLAVATAHGLDKCIAPHISPLRLKSLQNQILLNQNHQMLLKIAVTAPLREWRPTTCIGLIMSDMVSPPDDDNMLVAAGNVRLLDLKLLLSAFEHGQLRWRTTKDFPCCRWQSTTISGPEELMGPLWTVAHQVLCSEPLSDVLDHFLSRGEDINAYCSSRGTIVHSLIHHCVPRRLWSLAQNLKLLVSRGADITLSGTAGAPLDILWSLYKEDCCGKIGRQDQLQKLLAAMRVLVEAGAVSQSTDADGNLLSVLDMQSVIEKDVEQTRKDW